ncbi:MAG: hypothetical protein IJ298_08575 [Ruminococcus sp.]|nr:hypothetical protein [Ruminococcus sp.]
MKEFDTKKVRSISNMEDSSATELRGYADSVKKIGMIIAVIILVVGIITTIAVMINEFLLVGILILVGDVITASLVYGVACYLAMQASAKANLLDNTYRTEKLIELWMLSHCADSGEDDRKPEKAADKKAENKAMSTGNNLVHCPHCMQLQKAENSKCIFCGERLQ